MNKREKQLRKMEWLLDDIMNLESSVEEAISIGVGGTDVTYDCDSESITIEYSTFVCLTETEAIHFINDVKDLRKQTQEKKKLLLEQKS